MLEVFINRLWKKYLNFDIYIEISNFILFHNNTINEITKRKPIDIKDWLYWWINKNNIKSMFMKFIFNENVFENVIYY